MLITPPPRVRPSALAIVAALASALAVTLASPSPSNAVPIASSSSVADWLWPVDPPHTVVRPFIAPQTAYSAGHRGIDIAAPDGAPIRAPADGVVSFAGVVVDRPVLSITSPGGLIESFEPVISTLVAGAAVARGAVIGTVLAGHCAQTCLHFGVRLNGGYVSPLNYLGGIQRPVLLPTRAFQASF